jgi:hypothetical protein
MLVLQQAYLLINRHRECDSKFYPFFALEQLRRRYYGTTEAAIRYDIEAVGHDNAAACPSPKFHPGVKWHELLSWALLLWRVFLSGGAFGGSKCVMKSPARRIKPVRETHRPRLSSSISLK